MSALQLPVVLTKLSYLIDNPWTVSLGRAQMAGLILADSLMDRNLGTRPITLVGYSLGSRVIFTCLQELARKGAFGLVQNVFLFGSPVVVNQDEYLRARAVVSGRFVSAYNRNDWILGYLFRLTGGGIRRVAGLAPVEGIPGLENVDVSELVAGHMDYRRAMPRLLRECGFLVDSDEFTEIEDPDPENHGQRQRELINEIEEARKILEEEQNPKKGVKGAFGFFRKKKALQKQEWEVYEDKTKAAGGSDAATSSRLEDKDGNNHGVLFDVDAIRAELARADNRHDPIDEEMLQVREIKSTLPPMKLDLSPSPSLPSLALARNSGAGGANRSVSAALPAARSPGASTPTHGHARKPSLPQQRHASYQQHKSQPSLDRTSTFPASKAETDGYKPFAAGNGYHAPADDNDEIQMTFVESEPKPKPSPLPSPLPTVSSQSPNPSTVSLPPATPQRPEAKTAQTAPSAAVANPWADFDDDEDFGKEKEMTMTFA